MATGSHWYAGGPEVVTNLVARNVSCKAITVEGQNLTAGDRYLQIFDSNTLPVDGSVPLYSYLIGAGLLFAKTLPGPPPEVGRRMQNGLVIAWSTSSATLALAATAVGPIYADGQDLAPGGT